MADLLKLLNRGDFRMISYVFSEEVAEAVFGSLEFGDFKDETDVWERIGEKLKSLGIVDQTGMLDYAKKAIELIEQEEQKESPNMPNLYIPEWDGENIHVLRSYDDIDIELADEILNPQEIELLPGEEPVLPPEVEDRFPNSIEPPEGRSRRSLAEDTVSLWGRKSRGKGWVMNHDSSGRGCRRVSDSRFAIFLSDLHMSDAGIGDDFMMFHHNENGRIGRDKTLPISSIIEASLNKAKTLGIPPDQVDLVLVGDVVDLWELKARGTSLKHSGFFKMLMKFSSMGVHVYYLLGNHDFAAPNLPGYIISDFYSNTRMRIHAEHGHACDGFNNDPANLDSSGAHITEVVSRIEVRRHKGPTLEDIYPYRLIDNIKPQNADIMARWLLAKSKRAMLRVPNYKAALGRFWDRLTSFKRSGIDGFAIDLIGSLLSPLTSALDIIDETTQAIPLVHSVHSEIERLLGAAGVGMTMGIFGGDDRENDAENRKYAQDLANGKRWRSKAGPVTHDYVVLAHTHIKRFEWYGNGALINTGCCIPLRCFQKIPQGRPYTRRDATGRLRKVRKVSYRENAKDEITFCWIYEKGGGTPSQNTVAEMYSLDVFDYEMARLKKLPIKATQLTPAMINRWRRGLGFGK